MLPRDVTRCVTNCDLCYQFDRLVEANVDHIRLLEKLINPALFEDGVTRLNFILMAVVEAKNVAPLVARISKLRWADSMAAESFLTFSRLHLEASGPDPDSRILLGHMSQIFLNYP